VLGKGVHSRRTHLVDLWVAEMIQLDGDIRSEALGHALEMGEELLTPLPLSGAVPVRNQHKSGDVKPTRINALSTKRAHIGSGFPRHLTSASHSERHHLRVPGIHRVEGAVRSPAHLDLNNDLASRGGGLGPTWKWKAMSCRDRARAR
jgi:hypothetical protein